ncbi:Neuropeptide-Like Protein [Caenorhabditis elegans]|uniref:Neuropeptide-Like Protein n=1 Tax=Caenorhabditis elegans TaxID=6239 RepID=D0Z5P1_CAEEL|nr:Neuropeptide-Like Protein [Caenorhabditis elegans]CBI63245.1 Neuropeptide-Like Protein [Caenorhabditis elegans]|eukprot:NP_001255134.1 Uncharacterized protein CELE_Y66A7A.9 [Caenorhabditis elegans]
MLTATCLCWLFVFSLTQNSLEARVITDNKLSLEKRAQNRLKREFIPQNSPLNNVRSALQWRPNSQQPQGQVYK